MFEYLARRLETSSNNQFNRVWTTISISGKAEVLLHHHYEKGFCNVRVFLHFQEPNPEDPLNKEAAEVLQSNRRLFEQNVQKAMRGGYIGSVFFERCLK